MGKWINTLGYQVRGLPVLVIMQFLSWLRPAYARILSIPLAAILRVIARRRMLIAALNIKTCFPEKNRKQKKQLLLQHSRQLIYGLYETTQAVKPNADLLPPHKLSGLEAVQNCINAKQGVILICGHFSGMDLWLRLVGEYLPITAVHRPLKNPLMQRYFVAGRVRSSTSLISKHQPRAMLKALKAGCVLGLQSDQNSRGKNSRFIDFFGIPAATSISPWWLAQKSGATIFSMQPTKQWRSGAYHYEIKIKPMEIPLDNSKPELLLSLINQQLELSARSQPASYWWVHRRFKTRPVGEPTFY